MSKLNGKTAIVTGASRGIGEAVARALANEGASVALLARSEDDIDRIAADICESGSDAIAIRCDVSDYASFSDAVDKANDRFGSVDLLVNNAGLIDPIARMLDSDPEAWGGIIDINLKGVYHGIRAVLPYMVRQGAGTIINISSGAATSALEGWSHYCASKAAVLMLTRMIEKEYGAEGIIGVGLSPGTVATDMQREIKSSGINPVSQMDFDKHIPPQWVGQAIAWLASGNAEKYRGNDFSLKTDEGRAAVGLPPL